MSLAAITMMAMLALMTPAILITPGAYAVSSKVINRNQGAGGAARWNDISVEVPGIGTVVYAEHVVAESEGTAGKFTDIFVLLGTEEGNTVQGFTTIVDQNVFDAGNTLRSATLSPVRMEVSVSDESGNIIGTTEITVQSTWEGTGELHKEKVSQHFKSDGFYGKLRADTLLIDEGSAEVSINNANLGTTDDVTLFAFKRLEMEVDKSIIS